MYKIFFRFVIVVLLVGLWSAVALAFPPGQEGGQDYSVQADDWLSKLADKFLGDVMAYPAIVEATNAKAAQDTTYTVITNADLIEPGQKLYIPSATEASALLETTSTPVTLKFGAKCGPSPHVMPFFLMMAQADGQLGNVTVEYVPVTEPSQMAALLNTQQIDAMVGFVVQTASIYQKGGITNLRLVNIPLWRGFYVIGGENVTGWESVAGQVIAMPNPQSGPSQLGKASMTQAGFNPVSDFEIQNMPAAQIVQMLITGQAKAGVVSEPWATIAINKAKKEDIILKVTPINLYSVYESDQWPAAQLPIEGVLTSQNVLDDPVQAAAFRKLETAYYQAVEDMLANPAESSTLIAEKLTQYCDSKIEPQLIEQAISAGWLLYNPTPVGEIMPALDAYIEQMTGLTIDDAFYAQ